MKRLFLMFVFVTMMLAALPVAAQEVTVSPDVTAVPDVPPVVTPADTVPLTAAQLLLYLALAAFGGGGLLAILFRFLDRKEARDTGEKLYEAMPPDQQQFLKEVVNGYRELSNRLLDYFESITDGEPNEDAQG